MTGRTVRAGHRVFVEDARRNGQFLRVTWHGERGQFVVSNWDDNTCVGATRIEAADAPALMGVLADGLADAAAQPPPAPAEPSATTLRDHLRLWWRRRTARAAVIELRHHLRPGADQHRRAS